MSFIEYIDKNKTPRIVEYHDYTMKQYLFDITEEVRETEPLDEWNYYVFYVPEDLLWKRLTFHNLQRERETGKRANKISGG